MFVQVYKASLACSGALRSETQHASFYPLLRLLRGCENGDRVTYPDTNVGCTVRKHAYVAITSLPRLAASSSAWTGSLAATAYERNEGIRYRRRFALGQLTVLAWSPLRW